MYSEEVEVKGKYRASIIADEDAQVPDWDGMYPTLQLDNYSVGPLLGDDAVDFAVTLSTFMASVSNPLETFERYLRIFHGTTQFATHNIGHWREYGYVAFDTAKWRETHGVTVEGVKQENLLADVIAWADGDVWGVRVEKLVKWTTDDDDAPVQETHDWEDIETVWGYYGREYAEQEARDMLALYVTKSA